MLMVDVHELSALKRGLNATRNEKRKKELEKAIEYLEGNAIKVADLGVDYIIVGTERAYFIERKTLVDLANSIYSPKSKASGRFWEQLKRVKLMSRMFEDENGIPAYALLIAEGNIFQRYKARFAKFTPAQWMAIQVAVGELDVGLVRTWSLSETIMLLDVLEKRVGKPVKEIDGLNIKKNLRSIEEEAAHMLFAVSGIGSKKVMALLHRFGSVKNVVNASREDLVRVLGSKVGEHLYEVVNYNVHGGGLEKFFESDKDEGD